MKQTESKNGLGDKVESLIKTVLPKTAKKKENCPTCRKRKEFLNNVGAIFSS